MSKCYSFSTELENRFMIKEINFNYENKYLYPKIPNLQDLLFWTITPEKHRSYYRFWISVTFFNIISNLYVWFAL